jgi:hypothetical protein
MGRTHQREASLGGLSLGGGGDDTPIGRGALCPGATRLSGEIASVEHDQQLPCADAVPRYGMDLPDGCRDPGHQRGRRARLDDTARSNVSAISVMATVAVSTAAASAECLGK